MFKLCNPVWPGWLNRLMGSYAPKFLELLPTHRLSRLVSSRDAEMLAHLKSLMARVLTKTRKRLVAKCDTKVRKFFFLQQISKDPEGNLWESVSFRSGRIGGSISFHRFLGEFFLTSELVGSGQPWEYRLTIYCLAIIVRCSKDRWNVIVIAFFDNIARYLSNFDTHGRFCRVHQKCLLVKLFPDESGAQSWMDRP